MTSEQSAPEQIIPQEPRETIGHYKNLIRNRTETIRNNPKNLFRRSGDLDTTERTLRAAAVNELKAEMESGIDQLTGLVTKDAGERRKRDLLRIARTNGLPLTGVEVDLDDLKITNDTEGHEAGDRLIARAANLLKASVREGDLVIRKGGDEFEIILLNSNEEGAKSWEQRTRELLRQAGIRASIGTSAIDPSHIEESLAKADERMYLEKRGKKQPKRKIQVVKTALRKLLRKAA